MRSTFTYLVVFTLLSEKTAVGFFTKPCKRQQILLPGGGGSACCWRGWGNTANCKNLIGNQNIARGGSLLAPAATSKSTAESTKPQATSPTSQYFLLSTFAIWKSIVIKTFILFTIQIVMKTYLPRSGVSIEPVHEMCHSPNNASNWFYRLRDISLPLLSSACCAFQLFLNAFFAGMGCAGFNKVLGPLRPYFVSILLFTTITSTTFSKHKIIQVGLAWVVALMPEFVHVVNQRMSKMHAENQTVISSGSASENTSISTLPSSEEYMHRAVIELDIKDMGCVACINKIDGTLRSLGQNVIEAQSWLNTDGIKGGKVRVEVGLGDLELLDGKVEEMIGLVKDAGFQCEISNVKSVES